MNYSNPILICDNNAEFRALVREMLTKNGFFHVMEAAKGSEALEVLRVKNDIFVLISAKEVSAEITDILLSQNNYLIFTDNIDPLTLTLSAKLGVGHVMSYPFHSQKLMDKIHSFL
ncbi:MAG: hypothetical protein NDI69_12055 [Bacteriovoracaceae bacterium]|nr:hypothetical protein [Bacteriovoracaceae bacterium]